MKSQTYAEIKDQYNRLNTTLHYIDQKIGDTKHLFSKYPFVIYLGCGSSYYVAKSMAVSTMTALGKKAVALPAGDVLLRPKRYKELFDNALVVALSRSGSTSEILLACGEMEKAGSNFALLSFSCRTDQQLAKISSYAFEMPWAFDNSVCQTSSVSNLYFAPLYCISALSENSGLRQSLKRAVELGERFMTENEQAWKTIAEQDWNFGVTLGDAEIAGICEEGALAFKEICQLPSNYYPLLDSRHGPVVIMNEKTLVIAAISDVCSAYEKELIGDIKKRNCKIVTISDLPLHIEGTVNFCFGEKLEYPALGLPLINAAQMITCYKAQELNVDPDAPDGLDAWIKI